LQGSGVGEDGDSITGAMNYGDCSLSHSSSREPCGDLLLGLVLIQGVAGDRFSLESQTFGGCYCEQSTFPHHSEICRLELCHCQWRTVPEG
jgi:hypothetical protein